MSRLSLIRHGQATLGLESYDQLSDLGRVQSEMLGKYLATSGHRFDAVYHGTLKRQRQTAEIVSRVYEKEGKPFPELRVEPGLDEIDFLNIMREVAPRIQEEDPSFERLSTETMRSFKERSPEMYRLFADYYTIVFDAWTENRYDGLDIYSWEEYCERVFQTLDVLRSHGREERVAAFSSGTPMGLVVREALGLGMPAMMDVIMMLYNSNVTSFLLKKNAIVLESLNVTSHLPDEQKSLH